MTTPSDKQTDNQPAPQPPELLPCPFCGSTSIFSGVNNQDQKWTISCYDCPISIAAFDRKRVIAAWNTRARVVEATVDHVDFAFDNIACCQVCGLVRPAEGWKKPCSGVTPEIALRSERIEWLFRKKLGAEWTKRGREWIENYEMMVNGGGGMGRDTKALYGDTAELIKEMVRTVETLALNPAAATAPSAAPVESEGDQ